MKRASAGRLAVAEALPSRKHIDDDLPAYPTLEDVKQAEADASLADLEDRVNDVRESWETDSLFDDVFIELTNDDGQEPSSPSAGEYHRAIRDAGTTAPHD